MKRSESLREYMRAHVSDYLGALEGAVRRESPTEGDRTDLDTCRAYFAELFRSAGFQVTEIPSLDPRFAPHLLMEYGADAGSAAQELLAWLSARKDTDAPEVWSPEVGGRSGQILFGGHYDTVHDKGIFPQLWEIDGDQAVGPGVLDMKSGDVMVWLLVKAYQDLGLMPEGKRIVFLLTSDEEAGSYGSSALYRHMACRSEAAFIVESSVGVEGDYIGGLKCGRYGRGNYTFEAHGTPYHSGLAPPRPKAASSSWPSRPSAWRR